MGAYVGIVVIGAISIILAVVVGIFTRGEAANPDQPEHSPDGDAVAVHEPDAEVANVRIVGISLSFDDAFNLLLVFLAAQVVLAIVVGIISALFYWVVLN